MANNIHLDPNCVALWRVESGALVADTVGGNTLTNEGSVAENTTDYDEGACAADLESSSSSALTIADGDLDSDFPLKNGTSNNVLSWKISIRAESLPSSGSFRWFMAKYDTNSKRQLALMVYNNGGTYQVRVYHGYNNGASSESTALNITDMAVDTWFRVAYTYDESDSRAYYLKVLNASSTNEYETNGNWSNNISMDEDGEFVLGDGRIAGGPNAPWDGEFDEAAVWKDVLAESEIDEIFAGTYLAGTEITVPLSSPSFTGKIPIIQATANISITVPVAGMTAISKVAAVAVSDHKNVTVPKTDAALTSKVPTAHATENVDVEIPKSSAAFAGKAPTAEATENENITVPKSNPVFSAQIPAVEATAHKDIEVPQSQSVFASKVPAPAVSAHKNISVPNSTPVFTSKVPSVAADGNVDITVPNSTPAFASKVPSIDATTHFSVTVPKTDASLTSKVPIVEATANVWITVPKSNPVLAGKLPAVESSNNQAVTVPKASLSLQSLVPGVVLPVGVTVPKTSAAFTSKVPTVQATENFSVTVSVTALVFASKVPELNISGVLAAHYYRARARDYSVSERIRSYSEKARSSCNSQDADFKL